VLTVLQNLARKVRHATPYQLMAEAVEELHVRPILKARHPRGTERALANVELVLEMARAYAVRGMTDFARALWQRWEDGDAQAEGRPDAESNAVSITTMHSARGLEWPIVIPINSTTGLRSDTKFLYRRQDDSVHFKVFGYPSADYEAVAQSEQGELIRERVRLWYVALTRARDLLLIPRQSERISGDWLSLLTLNIEDLPALDLTAFETSPQPVASAPENSQDITVWERESAAIKSAERTIVWHQPSRHEGAEVPVDFRAEVFAGMEAFTDQPPPIEGEVIIQGGRERGLLLHKLMEEVLTGETSDGEAELKSRANVLLAQLGLEDHADPSAGPSSDELAATIKRTLELPEIVELRYGLVPEYWVYSGAEADNLVSVTAGIADAVALDDAGQLKVVVDWKSDVAPTATVAEQYRGQVRDYLAATGAASGLVVYMTSGKVDRIENAAKVIG
jgi:ATP-dependent exoDNAse (exonuclease V) beta subunit